MKRLRHPIRAIREPFGKAGLTVAIIALVFAMVGGAFAAAGLNGKQKKQVIKIAKKFAGKPGAAGAQGPAGLPGAKGDSGAKGNTGATGNTGNTGETGSTGEAGMCSAEEPECKLAPGGVLTGVWSAAGGEGDQALASISLPVRVSPAPTAVYEENFEPWTVGYQLEDGKMTLIGPYPCIQGCAGQGIVEQDDPAAAFDEAEAAWEAACPGSGEAPEASAGFLCIYKKDQAGSLNGPIAQEGLAEAANEFGVTVPFKMNADGSFVRGSWAAAG